MTQRSTPRRQQYTIKVEPVCTLQEVATELGITAEAVRQTEYRALRKLRAAMAEHPFGFEDFLEGR